MTPSRTRVLFTVLSIAALGLITTVNRAGAWALAAVAGSRALWLAELCVPSLLVCLFVYFAIRPARPLAAAQAGTQWRLARLGVTWLAIWLTASAVAAVIAGHWIRYTTGLWAVGCFVIVAPLQEELLFRGALFELVERGWRDAPRWGPIVGTTIPFALQHFQFHNYRLSSAALFQVGFTVPMGIVFARLRGLSGSVWPGFVVHLLTNLVGAFGEKAA